MLSGTYYAKNYISIILIGLGQPHFDVGSHFSLINKPRLTSACLASAMIHILATRPNEKENMICIT